MENIKKIKRFRFCKRIVLCFGFLCLLLATVRAQSRYTITDLGTLGGDMGVVVPQDINNRGEVVGYYRPHDSYDLAFISSGGQIRELGAYSDSFAKGINDLGQVAGAYSQADDFDPGYAFLYSNGQFRELMPSGDSFATAVNDRREMTGLFWITSGDPAILLGHAFLYAEGQVRDLGTLGGQESYGYSINNREQVVGYSDTTGNNGVYHAFLYSDGHMRDLGGFEPGSATNSSVAVRINDRGQVIGYAFLHGNVGAYHAFLYSGGKMRDLGTLPGTEYSEANGINNRGQIVGSAGETGAFLYANGQMRDLNALVAPGSGWVLVGANAINDFGQIAATGTLNGGQPHVLLLTPANERD
jgi:probable HAF family extracellular repeat protein